MANMDYIEMSMDNDGVYREKKKNGQGSASDKTALVKTTSPLLPLQQLPVSPNTLSDWLQAAISGANCAAKFLRFTSGLNGHNR